VRRSVIRLAQVRGALAGIAIIDLLSFYFFIGEAREHALAGGASIDGLVAVLSRAPVRALVIAVGIAGAMAFARAAGRLVAGLFPFLALMLLSSVHARLFGSPWRHLYYSGLCLLGWLMGLMVSRTGGRPSDESYARMGSVALLGAAYLNAGISKLAFGGLEWTSGAAIQAVVVAQDGLVRDGLLSAYRAWVAMSPAVVAFFSLATVVFELAGPLMMLGDRVRVIVAIGLLGMHLNIYLLTHILYWESMVLLIVFGVLPNEETPQPRAAAPPMLASRRAFIASVATLGVATLIAIGHQRDRYHARAPGHADRNTRPARLAEPAPSPLPSQSPPPRRIGPFSLGDRITEEWSIDALSPTDGGFSITLLGPAGRAAFEVNCTDVEHRSPFDAGSAHIYARDVRFAVVEAVGNVLRDRVWTAARPRDPCEAVKDWTRSIH
jgi:hypothetical protein